MAHKSKFTDAELENLESMGMKPSDIARKLGVTTAAVTQRQKKRDQAKPAEVKEKPAATPKAEPAADGSLSFDDLQPGFKFLRNGKPIFVKAVVNKNEVTIEDRFGYKGVIARKYFVDNPGKFARVEQSRVGDIRISGTPIKDLTDSAKEKIVGKLKEDGKQFDADRAQEQKIKSVAETIFPDGRKPATINQEFEAAVNEMEAEHKAKNDLTPCVHLTQDCKDPRGDDFDCTECPDYRELKKESQRAMDLDLEMEDSADPVAPFGGSSEPDYTDPEWFDKPIPRKGTVERAIWDKAYKEISEIQALRNVIRTALDRGDRLPTVYVDKYNKYVSKYSEEAGA